MVHQIGGKAKKILKFIPFDDWILSSEISDKTDFNSIEIGHAIFQYLIPEYVIRKKTETRPGGYIYVYKRLPILPALFSKVTD